MIILASAVFFENSVMICGGKQKKRNEIKYLSGNECYSFNLVNTVAESSWIKTQPMNNVRSSFPLVTVGNIILALGCKNHSIATN